MGKDDHKGQRTTRELDLSQLAALTKQPLVEKRVASGTAPPLPDDETDEAATPPLPVVSLSRTMTVDDPMTTAMLAEIARRTQTAELDDELIEALLGKIDAGETSHPHTRRRTR